MTIAAATLDALYGPSWRLKAVLRRGMFDKTRGLYDHPAKRKSLHSGRRAGKSNAIPACATMDALDMRPTMPGQLPEAVLLGGETLKKAKSLYKAALSGLIAHYQMPFTWNEAQGAFLHHRKDGTGIYLMGVTDKGAVDLARGFKVRAAWFDEVATYAHLLRYLAEDVLGPALGDLDGTLGLGGTPSLTRAGDWFELCEDERYAVPADQWTEGDPRWAVFHWDVRQNPYFPRDPVATLEAQARRYGGWDNPTFQREWLGLFVNDSEAQVYAWADPRNGCSMPAHFSRDAWQVSMGVDFGMRDDCAWVVGGNDGRAKVEYELHAEKHRGMLPDDACELTLKLCKEWGVTSMVGDAGGLGVAYVEQWNARRLTDDRYKGMPPMATAQKDEKRANIAVLNDELRSGRLMTVRAGCDPLIQERLALPWKDTARLVEDPRFANHCCDAALYRFRHSFAYLNAPPEPKRKPVPAIDSDEADAEDERRLLRKGREWWDV